MALKLFMVLLGGKPLGRHTEQHDVYFGIGETIRDLIPGFEVFWPEAKGKMHVDGWREVTQVNGVEVSIVDRVAGMPEQPHQLYFLNLGGYKKDEFEEFHYKIVVAAMDKATAIAEAKQTAFFKHTHFESAKAHIDDTYGVDVDDIYAVEDILPVSMKERYALVLTPSVSMYEDVLHLGYFKFEKL